MGDGAETVVCADCADWAEIAVWIDMVVAGEFAETVSPAVRAESEALAAFIPAPAGDGAESCGPLTVTASRSRSSLLSAIAAATPPVATTVARLPVTIQVRVFMVSSSCDVAPRVRPVLHSRVSR